ncbi:VWA domain-containing protein [Massilia violaceinigra]|uniref:VWA domain-containing protein n=1 Tax=Massilia violaceinigra TaxID=2045208 RepID=A0ABY4ABD7_9BURK|nr:vWA domain-containing protein [Massilia violaceinigra]UOD32121.1 VWA domain-containing protein [Massilia violaceinigra]
MIEHHNSTSPSLAPAPAAPAALGFFMYAALWVTGVIVPLIALMMLICGVWQTQTAMSGSMIVHLFLVALVALANAVLVSIMRHGRSAPPRPLALLHALATGASAAYAVLFLPLMLAGVVVLAYCGFSSLLLAALAPLVTLSATLAARRQHGWRVRQADGAPLPRAWPAVLLALTFIGALELPSLFTHIGMRMAADKAPAASAHGIRLLRYLGNERTILRACYARPGEAADLSAIILKMTGPTSMEDARAIYYRLTGTPFSAMPRPPIHTRLAGQSDDRDSDSPVVGAPLANLHLIASRIDGAIDARAALGSLEWRMVFHNDADNFEEARARMIVPAGAVVTRVTLWDDDGEHTAPAAGGAAAREFEFGLPDNQRAAVLVTSAGRDRIMLHLPVVPGGGEATVRIALSVPLVLNEPGLGYLQLPAFSERNFGIAPSLRHAVSVESASALRGAPAMREESGDTLAFAVRGELAEPLPGMGAPIIGALRAPADTHAWNPDPTTPGGAIVQVIGQQAARIPRRVALVVDGSASLAAQREQLARAATSFPGNVELGVIVAGAQAPQVFLHDTSDSLASVRYLQDISFEGGHDNSAALLMAWEWAGASSDGALVWIHGPQPLLPGSADALLQHFRQRPDRVRMVGLEAVTGPNVLWEKMDGVAALASVPRIGSLHDDLVRLLTGWKPAAQQVVVARSRASAAQPAYEQASPHLARLWAGERAMLLRANSAQATPAQTDELRQLDQLLTGTADAPSPAPAAQAGAMPQTAPDEEDSAVPVSATWLMLGVALAVLGWRMHFHRHTPYPASPE